MDEIFFFALFNILLIFAYYFICINSKYIIILNSFKRYFLYIFYMLKIYIIILYTDMCTCTHAHARACDKP